MYIHISTHTRTHTHTHAHTHKPWTTSQAHTYIHTHKHTPWKYWFTRQQQCGACVFGEHAISYNKNNNNNNNNNNDNNDNHALKIVHECTHLEDIEVLGNGGASVIIEQASALVCQKFSKVRDPVYLHKITTESNFVNFGLHPHNRYHVCARAHAHTRTPATQQWIPRLPEKTHWRKVSKVRGKKV